MNASREVNYFFSSPSWRWDRANYEYGKSRKGEADYQACNDVIVRSAIRFLHTWKDESIPKDRLRQIFPHYTKLIDIYQDVHPGCARFGIEACAMALATPEWVVSKMGFQIDPFMYRMYKLLFFDVDLQVTNGSMLWLEEHVFAKSKKYTKPLNDSGHKWKTIGFNGGPEMLLKVCFPGHTDEATNLWIRKSSISETNKQALVFTYDRPQLPVEIDGPAKGQILGTWLQEADKRAADLQNGGEGATVNQIGALTTAIKAFGEKDKLDKTENVASDKYTDKDLQI